MFESIYHIVPKLYCFGCYFKTSESTQQAVKRFSRDAGTGISPTAATGHVSINTLISLWHFTLGHGEFVQINGLVEISAQEINRAGKFSGQDLKKGPPAAQLLPPLFPRLTKSWKNHSVVSGDAVFGCNLVQVHLKQDWLEEANSETAHQHQLSTLTGWGINFAPRGKWQLLSLSY